MLDTMKVLSLILLTSLWGGCYYYSQKNNGVAWWYQDLPPGLLLLRYSSLRSFLLLFLAFSPISIIFVRGWELYICNSRIFFLLGFRQPTAGYYYYFLSISNCTSNESSPRSSPRMFPGEGGGGPFGISFSLCSLRFWKAKLSGVGRVKSLSHPFNSNLNFPYSLVFSLDVWGSNLLPDNSLMKLFLNLTVYWVTCLVFQKWGFLRLCFQPTRQDAEGLETRLILRGLSFEC